MPATSDNGAAAMAAAATAAALAAEDQAHRARCTVVLQNDPRGSVDQMQTFSSCVEFMHPQIGPATKADKVLWGGLGLLMLVCIIMGAAHLCRTSDHNLADRTIGALFGTFFGAIAGAGIGGLILGGVALVQFLLS